MGAKAGQRGKPGRDRDRAPGRQRLGLILFGALLVALFVGFAVAQGIGSPSVPSGDVAKVEDVPSEFANFSQDEFDRALVRQVAQAKLKKTPAPGSSKYEELKKAVMTEQVEAIWIRGEAEELGVQTTEKQVEEELAQIKKQNFPGKGAYEKFLKESKFTDEDVHNIVEVQTLGNAIQEKVNSESPAPSQSEISDYYEAEKASQFTEKESRDVRVITNSDKAKVVAAKKVLEKDSSPKSWEAAAKKYSNDPLSKKNGGLQEGVTEEFLKGDLKEAIFSGATGELKGPIKFQNTNVLVEVVKLHPAKVKSLAEVKAQIEETLKGEKQQEFFAEFLSDYKSKWQSRTICADGFEVEEVCSNAKSSGHPANAAPACYEADPKTPATECPAPVTPISPALPGSVTPQEPKGKPFPQRPIPESATKETGTEVPGGAVPPGEGEAEAPPAETGE